MNNQVLQSEARSRLITSHIVNPSAEKLQIHATDVPGAGGANHRYEISGYDSSTNPSGRPETHGVTTILFQNGTIPENGVNGLTLEVIFAVAIDRLQSFQNGPFACKENQLALDSTREALAHLQERTLARMRRGVEGTHTV